MEPRIVRARSASKDVRILSFHLSLSLSLYLSLSLSLPTSLPLSLSISLSLSLYLGELFSKPRAGHFELRSANCAQITVIGYALRLEFVTDR